MNRKQVKKYIDKINALNNSIMADEAYSEMETDLLESYAKSLLESITGVEIGAVESKPVAKKVAVAAPIATEAPVVDIPPSVLEETPVAEEAVQVIQEPVATPPPVVEHKPEAVKPKATTVQEPSTAPPPATKPATAPAGKAKQIPELEELFEHKAVKELSDKLKMQPIKDLTTSISINERIFTTQELFGGDQEKFKSTLSKINEMASYDDAKTFLINGIAQEEEWYSEAKQKKAAQFIQLVKRRFSSN